MAVLYQYETGAAGSEVGMSSNIFIEENKCLKPADHRGNGDKGNILFK